jgi:uncharacterized OB-fold protein
MRPGIGLWRCVQCQARFFPQRLLCARCHGSAFDEDRVYEAVVEEVSVIRHMLGQTDWQPRRIASVRIADELRITVGLIDECGPGAVVELFEQDGAPFGKVTPRPPIPLRAPASA